MAHYLQKVLQSIGSKSGIGKNRDSSNPSRCHFSHHSQVSPVKLHIVWIKDNYEYRDTAVTPYFPQAIINRNRVAILSFIFSTPFYLQSYSQAGVISRPRKIKGCIFSYIVP